MKKYLFIPFVSVSILLLATACRQVEFEGLSDSSNILTGYLERGAETKTHFAEPIDDVYYPYWTAADALAVYVDNMSIDDKYTLKDGAGTEKGSFTGRVSGKTYVALYPYADRVKDGLEGNVLHLQLPSVQTYQEGSIGEGAFPMIATGGEDGLSFKNLCSVLKLSMTGSASVKEIRFVAHDGEMPVSGLATVRTDYTSAPELVMDPGGLPSVALDCSGIVLDEENVTDFMLVIPPGLYKGGFSIEVETFSGTFTRSIESDVSFGRSQFRFIAPFRCDTDGEINPDDIPYNQIWYVSESGRPVKTDASAFDRNILSHTYEDGKGVIVFDGNLTKVGDGAFFLQNLLEVHLPNTVEHIGSQVFEGSLFKSFHTPDNLKSIARDAFENCRYIERFYGLHASSDEKAVLDNNGTMVIYAPAAIEETIVIPSGVKALGEYLFFFDHKIREIILPEGLTELGEYCLCNCTSLETVTFSESVEKVGDTTFSGCSSLREFKGTNPMIPDGHSFIDEDGYMKVFAGSEVTDYVIPEGVIAFYTSFCNMAPALHSLTMPESLKFISSYAFDGCDNLEFFYGPCTSKDHHSLIVAGYLGSVTNILPADYSVPAGYGIVEVFYGVFAGNKYLERLSLPDEIKYIDDNAFANMPKLKSLRLPAGLELISNPFNGTTSLDTIYVRSYSPPLFTEYDDAFIGHEGLVICVPRGVEIQYKSAPTWSKYADYIQGYDYDDLKAPDYYMSTDYSRDGVVTRLQKAKKGQGVDIVLMGDAFSDRQIADGTYKSVMNKMMEAFFSEEPYTTYRDLFNVYSVDVVSTTEGYANKGQALGGWFGNGTEVGGSDERCIEYALKAVSADRMDNTLIIVAMNSDKYAGTCWMHDSVSENDYGSGTCVAYFPIGTSDEGLEQLVHHEAGGHGFAKLADEYAYEYMGTVPQDVIDYRSYQFPYGWWKNADFTNDPNMVKWARFLAEERYQYDGLGCFEGAFTYWKGAWRPTDTSIMRYNTGGFNAPSREAIWYRLHKLAYGDSWEYDYEEFVAYDAVNRKTAASASAPRRYAPEKPFTPTAPPVLTGMTWREALQTRPDRRPKSER